MIILTMRTDNPMAEIGLYDDARQVAYEKWQAHRELSNTIHQKIQSMLTVHHQSWQTLQGIVVYAGPGSFTGLRIGIAVANTAASSLDIPIVASAGDTWLEDGIAGLLGGKNEKFVVPQYGRDPHITAQKK